MRKCSVLQHLALIIIVMSDSQTPPSYGEVVDFFLRRPINCRMGVVDELIGRRQNEFPQTLVKRVYIKRGCLTRG